MQLMLYNSWRLPVLEAAVSGASFQKVRGVSYEDLPLKINQLCLALWMYYRISYIESILPNLIGENLKTTCHGNPASYFCLTFGHRK